MLILNANAKDRHYLDCLLLDNNIIYLQEIWSLDLEHILVYFDLFRVAYYQFLQRELR